MPNVVVTHLALNATSDVLTAATHGYGMFARDLQTSCAPVDVYVRDNKLDTGRTIPSPSALPWWQSADLKIDAPPHATSLLDGVDFDLFGSEGASLSTTAANPNRAYVQVHNRGSAIAHNVIVRLLWSVDSASSPTLLPADFWTHFPNDSALATPWRSVNASLPFQTIPELQPGVPAVLQWDWNVAVSSSGTMRVLLIVSADEDPVVRNDSAPQDHDLAVIVPNDKHIALRSFSTSSFTASSPTRGRPGSPDVYAVRANCCCTTPPSSCPSLLDRIRNRLRRVRSGPCYCP
jgi:hypothetical protein